MKPVYVLWTSAVAVALVFALSFSVRADQVNIPGRVPEHITLTPLQDAQLRIRNLEKTGTDLDGGGVPLDGGGSAPDGCPAACTPLAAHAPLALADFDDGGIPSSDVLPMGFRASDVQRGTIVRPGADGSAAAVEFSFASD